MLTSIFWFRIFTNFRYASSCFDPYFDRPRHALTDDAMFSISIDCWQMPVFLVDYDWISFLGETFSFINAWNIFGLRDFTIMTCRAAMPFVLLIVGEAGSPIGRIGRIFRLPLWYFVTRVSWETVSMWHLILGHESGDVLWEYFLCLFRDSAFPR